MWLFIGALITVKSYNKRGPWHPNEPGDKQTWYCTVTLNTVNFCPNTINIQPIMGVFVRSTPVYILSYLSMQHRVMLGRVMTEPNVWTCFSDKFHAWMELLLDALSLISASRDKNDCNIRKWLLAYVLAMFACNQNDMLICYWILYSSTNVFTGSGVEWAECSLITRAGCRVHFLAWSLIAQSVCKQTISLLAIWCLRPWARILHSAEENNLSPFDSNSACLCHARASKLPATSIYIVAIVLLQLSPLCIILVGKFGEPLRDQ